MTETHLAIVGLGMVSSLGLDRKTSCAAARAGLNRSKELEFEIDAGEDNQTEAINGHTIHTLDL